MIRRAIPVAALCVLVFVAGCSGLGGADGVPTTTPADDGADQSPDGEEIELVENRTAALRDAGGYTAVWEMSFSEGGETAGATTYTHAVDYVNERFSFAMRMTGDGEASSDYETFHADGVTYARHGAGDDAGYQVMDAPFAPGNVLFSVTSFVADAGDLDAFTAVGTETHDGVTVTRYERTDRPSWVAAQAAADDAEFTWTEFTYSVLVDGDGLVRAESWGGEGVDDEGVDRVMEFNYTLTDVGSTAVEEPAWVATARDNAD